MDDRLRGAYVRLGLILAAIVIAADQATKAWALDRLFEPREWIVVTPFLNFVPVWNRGVSFGMLSSGEDWAPYALAAFATAVSIALVVWLFRAERRFLAIGLAAVIGGAVGNVIDRLRFGAVVDFIDVHAAGYHWPAFNIADAAITLGVAVLLVDSFQSDGPKIADKPSTEE